MLSQLSTLKQRLAIPAVDVQFDDLLTAALTAISVRFDRELSRTLVRTASATFEFADETEIIPACYPIESVSKFELKTSEAEGWLEQTGVQFLIRRSCIISLQSPICNLHSAICTSRVTYTGGYVLPGDTVGPGQTPLPADLEQAAIEQTAAWFLNRDKIGLEVHWPKGGVYEKLSQLPLLPQVQAVLSRYTRWAI